MLNLGALIEDSSLVATVFVTVSEIPDNPQVRIGGQYYDTLANAIAAAKTTGDTITLLKDVNEDVIFPAGKTVTLDLNDHNLTAVNGDAIVNRGNLIITGAGTVSASAKGHAAIANFPDAKATIDGGTYKSENWYVIKNMGTMTINDGEITTDNSTNPSSLIDNGWYGSVDTVAGEQVSAQAGKANLTIQGGDFTGTAGAASCSVVKNDDYGTLTINGGTFDSTANTGDKDAATIINWNVATISGGIFTGSYPISNGYLNDSADQGTLTITGGTFTGTTSILGENANDAEGGSVTIKGGSFDAPKFGTPENYAVKFETTSTSKPITIKVQGTVDSDTTITGDNISGPITLDGTTNKLYVEITTNASKPGTDASINPIAYFDVALYVDQSGNQTKVTNAVLSNDLTVKVPFAASSATYKVHHWNGTSYDDPAINATVTESNGQKYLEFDAMNFSPFAVTSTSASDLDFDVKLMPQENTSGGYFFQPEGTVTYNVVLTNNATESVTVNVFDFGVNIPDGLTFASSTSTADSTTITHGDGTGKIVVRNVSAKLGQTMAASGTYTIGTVTFTLGDLATLKAIAETTETKNVYTVPDFELASGTNMVAAEGYQNGVTPSITQDTNQAQVKLNYSFKMNIADAYNGEKDTATYTPISGVTSGSVDYGTDVIFTLTPKDGYKMKDVSVTVGGYTHYPTVSGSTYTIPGTSVTGDIVVTATTEIDFDDILVYSDVKALAGGAGFAYDEYCTGSNPESLVLFSFNAGTGGLDVTNGLYETIYDTGDHYKIGTTSYKYAMLVDLRDVVPTAAGDLNPLKEYLKYHLKPTDTANTVIDYDHDVNGSGSFLVDDISVAFDFTSIVKANYKWDPADGLFLKADTDWDRYAIAKDVAEFVQAYLNAN